MHDAIPDYCSKSTLVLGCGNILFGDDGFGPAVADHLVRRCSVPDDVEVLNVETSARPILFDITLSERRPRRIIIADAFESGKAPGELFLASVMDIPEVKIDDFSMHQIPTSNLLRELETSCGVEILVLACQVKTIPSEISPGLSEEVAAAVPRACELILEAIAAGETPASGPAGRSAS